MRKKLDVAAVFVIHRRVYKMKVQFALKWLKQINLKRRRFIIQTMDSYHVVH